MTQTPIKLTFEEYLTYDDGTDNPEYQALNIPEYWIVDPIKKQVTIKLNKELRENAEN